MSSNGHAFCLEIIIYFNIFVKSEAILGNRQIKNEFQPTNTISRRQNLNLYYNDYNGLTDFQKNKYYNNIPLSKIRENSQNFLSYDHYDNNRNANRGINEDARAFNNFEPVNRYAAPNVPNYSLTNYREGRVPLPPVTRNLNRHTGTDNHLIPENISENINEQNYAALTQTPSRQVNLVDSFYMQRNPVMAYELKQDNYPVLAPNMPELDRPSDPKLEATTEKIIITKLPTETTTIQINSTPDAFDLFERKMIDLEKQRQRNALEEFLTPFANQKVTYIVLGDKPGETFDGKIKGMPITEEQIRSNFEEKLERFDGLKFVANNDNLKNFEINNLTFFRNTANRIVNSSSNPDIQIVQNKLQNIAVREKQDQLQNQAEKLNSGYFTNQNTNPRYLKPRDLYTLQKNQNTKNQVTMPQSPLNQYPYPQHQIYYLNNRNILRNQPQGPGQDFYYQTYFNPQDLQNQNFNPMYLGQNNFQFQESYFPMNQIPKSLPSQNTFSQNQDANIQNTQITENQYQNHSNIIIQNQNHGFEDINPQNNIQNGPVQQPNLYNFRKQSQNNDFTNTNQYNTIPVLQNVDKSLRYPIENKEVLEPNPGSQNENAFLKKYQEDVRRFNKQGDRNRYNEHNLKKLSKINGKLEHSRELFNKTIDFDDVTKKVRVKQRMGDKYEYPKSHHRIEIDVRWSRKDISNIDEKGHIYNKVEKDHLRDNTRQ